MENTIALALQSLTLADIELARNLFQNEPKTAIPLLKQIPVARGLLGQLKSTLSISDDSTRAVYQYAIARQLHVVLAMAMKSPELHAMLTSIPYESFVDTYQRVCNMMADKIACQALASPLFRSFPVVRELIEFAEASRTNFEGDKWEIVKVGQDAAINTILALLVCCSTRS